MSACNINLTPEDKEFANSLCEYIINNADSISISEVLTESFSDTVSEVSNKVVLRIYKYVESKLKGSIEDSLLHSEIQKSYDKYIELQNNATPEFNIDSSLKFNTNQNKFIYLIDNMSLNSELYLTSKADFTKILLLSIQNNSNIDDQIYELVSAYLSDIYTYLYPDSAEEFELTKDNYINLLTEALVKVKDNLRISLNNPAHISKVKLNKQHIEILRKIHVLNNFDNLLEHFLGVVSITPSLKGKIVYVDKYSLALKGLMHKGYGDDSSKSDSNNILSKLLLLMWNTIPDGSGGFLNKKDFEYIIQKLNLNGNRKYDSIDKVIRELKTNVKDFGLKGAKVAEWLEEQKNSYNKTLQDTTLPITYKKNLEHYFNFTDTFMYQIQVRNNVAYISTDSKGATVKQPEIYLKDKSYIYNGMLNTLLENITEKGNLTFVTYSEYLSIKNYPLTSKEYINFLNKLTGLHLTPESMSRLLSENSQDSKGETAEDKIREFVHTYTREVSNLRLLLLNAKLSLDARVGLAQIKDLINDFIQKKIVFDPTYVAFSDIIVKNNYDSTMKVLDLKGNQLANSAIPNNFLKLHENILLLQDVLRRELDANILITTDYQGKATTSKYIKKDASNIYDKYCYSAYRGAVQIGNDVIDHEKLTSEELMSLSFNYEFIDSACNNNTVFLQPICYADKTRIGLVGFNANALIGDFKLRDGSLQKRVALQRKSYYRNLEEDIITRYNKVFNKDFSSLDEVLSFILNNLNLIKGNIHKLRDGIDIIKTKNSKGDTLYTFNYVQYQFILDAHLDNGNIDKLIEKAREEFKSTFYSIKIPVLFKEQSYLNNNKKFFEELFEIKESDWETFVKAIKTNKTWEGVEEDLKSKAISISDKYFYISNLGSDSILLTAGLVFTSYGDSKQGERDIKVFDENKIKTLLSENFAKGTKRHNFFTASYQAPLIGTKYGVNQYSNYLVVEDLSQNITNYYGDEHDQDVHDGMILASALQTYWELNSYPELDYGETMKVIGLMPSGFTARLIKCAQYSISNWKIRQGFDSNDPKVWNLKKLNERLLKSGKLNPNFILKLISTNLNIAADIAINENGVFYQFLGFEIEPSGEVSTIWESNEGATTKITRSLETAYDLWELLGAEWSYALQDGDYVESENSMKITADLISECSPETKESMITKIIPKAAFKTGLENIHSINLVYDDNFELLPIQWNNDYLGIQQDYDHEADDSEVPSLTLLINNVAFNGANVELVNQVWDTLSFLIDRTLKKYDYLANDGADLDTVHKRIAKMMLEKIQSSNSPSNNLTKLLEEAMKGNGLVISDLSLFYKFASDLMALLNHTSIKSKSRGIAIILNPSQGLLGVYETADGSILMEEDARRNPITETSSPVDVNELAIEDVVEYIDNKGKRQLIRVSNIHDLIELKRKQEEEHVKLRKVHNVKRNLKSPTLTYKVMEDGKEVTKSWWLAPWTLERWEAEAEYKKNPTKANALRVMKSKRWYLANLKALENNTLFLTEDLSSPTLIISYNYTGGEQILPKVFKTKYGLKNSTTLHEVLSRGEEFFIELFNEVYKQPEENITSYTQGKFSLGFFFKDYNVYYTENTQLDSAIRIDLTEDNTIVEEGNRWYTVNGKKQFIVPSEANAIYKDNNNFIVNAKVEGENADNKFIQTLTEQEECKGALAYFKNKVANTKNKTIKYVLNSFNPFNYNSLSKKGGLDAAIQHCAALKLKGFKLTLDTISVRIPTQAYQSFMRNTTVGFTNSDSNDGYINLMQIWFTGGDYDIDKSYTLMYDTDENGVVPTTSNLYKKGLDIDKCFDLPLPDNSKNVKVHVTKKQQITGNIEGLEKLLDFEVEDKPDINSDPVLANKLRELAQRYASANESYDVLKEGLDLIKDYKVPVSSDSFIRKTYLGNITALQDNQIFVFGSNPEGRHGAGAAKYARSHFGAEYGKGEGLQGQSYALPTKDIADHKYARYADNGYELSSEGDTRFSALKATFKEGTVIFGHDVSGRTIESVYLHGIKQGDWVTDNNKKTGAPKDNTIIKGNNEDASYYEGYLPLWQEWAKQNPELIEDLRKKSQGKVLTDKFASTAVSQARALAEILNGEKDHKRSLSKDVIIANISTLYETARQNSDKEFLIAYSADGKNLNGYTSQEMAEMFAALPIPANIVFELGFNELVKNSPTYLEESPKVTPKTLAITLDRDLDILTLKFVNDLNTHNNTNVSKTALQNRITNGLIRCSGNVNNMQASQQPMTSDEIKELIDDCEKELENFDKTKYSNFSKTFDVFNPTAKWEIQQEAIVGKGDVGISANGIKVDSLLLLYYNDYYRTWDPETPIEETYKVDVPIKLWIQNEEGEYKTIINKNIVRFGDTVLDKDDTIAFKKFKALYKDISDQDLYKEKEYLILLQGLKDPFSLTTRREKNAYTSYITIIGNEKLNRENYLRWLFEKEKLGSRVSDNLSVFISLAVDNMKEMQLARIYGNEELLKIPLTLIMLGVDPHDVMLFCKTMLKPIYEELSVNRYNSKKKGLASIISREIHNYKDNPARFIFSKDAKTNKAIAQQILSILKIADNTTLLSKVFKINQGLTATYGDLTNEQASLNIALSEVAGAEITLEDLFLDPTLVLKTEKRGFDIIDVIKKSRYFKTMHEAALKLIRNIDSVASRAFVHKKLSRHTGDLKDKNTRELALRGFLYLYDHFIIGKTLQSLTQFTFTKESLEKGLNTDLGSLPIIAGKPFALNSNDNLALFIQVMDELIIPKLQKQYPNNYAIKSFTKVFSKRLNRNVYDLPFNNLDTNNIEELENLKRAIAEFSLIANNNSGLLNIANLPITIIDALNVYQMITKRDSISSFKDMVTENSVMGKNLVYTRKNNIIKGYDNNIYEHMTQGAPLRNDLLLELLGNQELINAVLGTSDSIELEHAMVWTLEKPKKKLSRDLFISELRLKGIEVEQLNGDNYRIHYGDYDKIHYIPKEVDTKGVANEILSNYEALKFITDYMNNVFLSEELKNNLEQNKVFNEITSQLFSDKAFIYNTIIPNNNIDYLLQPSYIIEFNTVVKLNFTSDNPSENEVVYTLLNYKFGDNLPEHVKYLQTNLTQDNKQEVIDAYTEYYLNNNITKQDLHNALNFLQDSVDYLKAEDVFYELRFSKKDASSLQEGDLIEINNDTFIFAGNYNKSNKLINVNTGEILYNKDTLYDAKKLKVPFGTQISKLKPAKKELGKKGKLKDLPINSTFELQGVRYRIVYKFVSSNGDIETVVVDNNEGIGSFLNSQGNIEVNYVELNTNKEDMTTIVLEGMQNPEEYLSYIKAGDTVTINSEEGIETATVITITKDKKIRVDKLDTPVELSNVKLVQLSTRISSSEFTQEAYNDKDNKDTFNYESLYTPLKHLPSKFNKGDIIKRNNRLYKIYSVSNNEIIAEVFTCNKETSASSLEVLPHTIEVFTPKDIDIVYTKDKTTIYNDIAELQALDTSGDLSLDAKATLFIGHLKELGLKVRYTTGLTRFEGDIIYINENYKTDVLHLLMHEATHLALANLKLNSREAYLYLLEEVKKLPLDTSLQALFLSIDNDPRYPTELDKLEEKLIRYMDEKFKNAFILNSKDADFNDANIFNKYLKYSLEQMGLKMELGKILTNLIVDKFNLKKFDLEKVTQDKVIDSVLNNVKRVC